MGTIFLLLIIYQLKHFVADYLLQGRYMLGKFKNGFAWILPLAAHSGVHAVMTYIIALFFNSKMALTVAVIDFVLHFAMDRVKASPSLLGRYKALSANEMKNILSYLPTLGEAGVKEKFGKELKSNTYFWFTLGIDQGVHHLTHYLIIWMLLS